YLSSRLRCPVSISFETHAKHIQLLNSELCRPLARCLRDAGRQSLTPMPHQIRSAVWPMGQLLHPAPHIRHIRCPVELDVEMRAHLVALSRSRREGADLIALYINMSIDMNGQDESANIAFRFPKWEVW